MRSPRASSSAPIDAEASPLPSDESTPPVTKMNLVALSAVMLPPSRPSAHLDAAVAPEAVLDPHVVDRDEGLRQRIPGEEADARHLARRLDLARLAGDPLEAEVHGVDAPAIGVLDHLARRIRVDADQAAHLDAPARLLAHRARGGVPHRLAGLEVAAREPPVPVVAALHQQDLAPTRLAAHDRRDGEAHLGRVRGEVARHALVPRRITRRS